MIEIFRKAVIHMKRNKYLFRLLKGQGIMVFFIVILTIVHRLTFSYIPLFTQTLINKLSFYMTGNVGEEAKLPRFIIGFINQYEQITHVILAIVASLIIWQLMRYVLLFLESRLRGVLSENVGNKLRITSYDHIQNLSYHYHNNVDSGDLIQRVTSDIDLVTRFVSYRILDFLGLFSSIIFGAYQLFFINKTIMFLSLSIVPISAIASIIYFVKIDKVFKDVEEKESDMMVVIQENVSASRVVKATSNEQYELEKLDEKNKLFRDADIRAGKIVAVYWGSMDTLMMFQYMMVLMLGIYFAYNNQMDIASITAALMLAGMLIWPVRGLGRIINDYGKALVASSRLEEIFLIEDEYKNDGVLTPEITGDIEFKNVSFKFIGDEEYTLKDVSFSIRKGQTVAFIGKTGSGKSTIINILLKMLDYEGSIKVNEIELKDIQKRHLRSHMGTVLQDPFLYSKTVYENIAIASKQASPELIYQASVLASLDKDIKTFQSGYETIVGEQGTTLSGGQKQRVAIARILVSEKPIIIFDDALSALDNKTDLEIRKTLKEKRSDQTNIIITHRMTTAKEADLIVVVNNQTIEAIGTHEELKSKEGLYKILWDIQGELEDAFIKDVKEAK